MADTEVTEDKIAAAVEAMDNKSNKVVPESTATSSSTSFADDHEEPKTAAGMMKLMKKHSDGTNVIKESIKTFSNPFGSDKKGDVLIADKNDALTRIQQMVESDRQKHKPTSKKALKWDFRASPHSQFDKTLEDTYLAFVQWAKTTKDTTEEEPSYNVSKAFRRLTAFAQWMEDSADDLMDPLTPDSVKDALKAWNMKCSIGKDGDFCWWIDFAQIDENAIKSSVTPTDSLRAFVWYAHYVMYDKNAQEKGLIFIESVAKVGFIRSMTLIPMKVGAKLDRLTIGVLPIKMNALYMLETPKWIDIFMKIINLFMSKKMKERMIILKDWNKVEEIVGKECIPKPFGPLEGSLAVDPVDAKYFS